MEILRVQKLTKDFGGLRALQEIDIQVQKGQIKALIGPNGAGKTTLFNTINGFLSPTGGQIFLEGEDITCLKPHIISRKGVGRAFQTPQMFGDMSVLENVMVGFCLQTKSEFIVSGLKLKKTIQEEKEIRGKALEILGLLNLEQQALTWAKNLSFPQMRLLEIGRALATHPKLLLLDEPSAGFSPMESSLLAKDLIKIRDSGTTIFFIDHNISLVMEISDEIIVLKYGEKIAEGSPDQVQMDGKVISSYLGNVEKRNA